MKVLATRSFLHQSEKKKRMHKLLIKEIFKENNEFLIVSSSPEVVFIGFTRV